MLGALDSPLKRLRLIRNADYRGLDRLGGRRAKRLLQAQVLVSSVLNAADSRDQALAQACAIPGLSAAYFCVAVPFIKLHRYAHSLKVDEVPAH